MRKLHKSLKLDMVDMGNFCEQKKTKTQTSLPFAPFVVLTKMTNAYTSSCDVPTNNISIPHTNCHNKATRALAHTLLLQPTF